MPKKTKKISTKQKNSDIYFDTENVKLILLCFLFGVFGVHKFVQGKRGQGIAFVLLDLTIVGFIVTAIWSWCNLIALTFKKDNKVGNMVVGACCIAGSLFGMPSSFDEVKTILIKENIISEQESYINHETLVCSGVNNDISFKVGLDTIGDETVVLRLFDEALPLKQIEKSSGYSIYQGVFWKTNSEYIKLDKSSNPKDIITVKIPKSDDSPIRISGKFIVDDFDEYVCLKSDKD